MRLASYRHDVRSAVRLHLSLLSQDVLQVLKASLSNWKSCYGNVILRARIYDCPSEDISWVLTFREDCLRVIIIKRERSTVRNGVCASPLRVRNLHNIQCLVVRIVLKHSPMV